MILGNKIIDDNGIVWQYCNNSLYVIAVTGLYVLIENNLRTKTKAIQWLIENDFITNED